MESTHVTVDSFEPGFTFTSVVSYSINTRSVLRARVAIAFVYV